MEENYREVKKAEPCLKLIHMDQVEVEEIEWLFYPFIPYGKVTIIQGDPGEGKTTVVLQIIAKLTKGESILNEVTEEETGETGVEPINVIYQTAEDGLGDTIKPRLLAAGADCSRVLVIDDQDQPLTMVDARLEVEELTEHKNLLEHDLHNISECVDEIQKEKEQAEQERDAVIKRTEVLEKRFSALNSKAGLVDSHAREYGYYPEEWLPEAGTLESAKSYRKRIFPLLKKVANMIQSLYSQYLELKDNNRKLSDRNRDLESRVERLREEVSVIKKENVALLNVAYDMDRVVTVLGENKVKEAVEVAKHLEQANAKQKIKKRRIDRDDR